MSDGVIPVTPYVFALLSFVAYRVTAFFVADKLIGFNEHSESEVGVALRNWARDVHGHDRVWWRGRVYDLLSCTFCLGAHVSWILTCLWLWVWPWQLGREGWLVAVALAGAQALLNLIDNRVSEG